MGIKVANVSKTYGDKKVVDNISFEMSKPGVLGLLGTNGAGKTTTIRMILGIISKDNGIIEWNGKSVSRKNVKFGYLPEERGLYLKTKVEEQLLYIGQLKGLSKKEAKESIKKWATRLKIEEYLNMTADKLSKGNQQKVQFLTAVIDDPELIVLDEPFSGLDPVNTDILRNVILELVEQGKYIIMSSHQMNSVEEFAEDIVILNKGKTVVQGNLKQIRNSYKANRISLITNKNVDVIIKSIDGLTIKSNKDNEYIIEMKNEKAGNLLFSLLAQNEVVVEKFELMRPSLHDIFVEKVGE